MAIERSIRTNMYANKAKFQYGPMTPHQTGLGNIDLDNRPINIMPHQEGEAIGQFPTIRTEESITVGDGLGFVNIPTIINGMKYSNEDAIMHYKLTGQHLGKFAPSGIKEPWSDADKAANAIHLRQEKMYTGQPSAQ